MADGYSLRSHMSMENLQTWESDEEDKGRLGKGTNLQCKTSHSTGQTEDELREGPPKEEA